MHVQGREEDNRRREPPPSLSPSLSTLSPSVSLLYSPPPAASPPLRPLSSLFPSSLPLPFPSFPVAPCPSFLPPSPPCPSSLPFPLVFAPPPHPKTHTPGGGGGGAQKRAAVAPSRRARVSPVLSESLPSYPSLSRPIRVSPVAYVCWRACRQLEALRGEASLPSESLIRVPPVPRACVQAAGGAARGGVPRRGEGACVCACVCACACACVRACVCV